ncbi:hypothetical protein LTR37_006179 [Vermiconidia calcicola]|uniref:Uncharacterized protein n=1 Tax=Vermiconidia calcicola TaxID=1690605 RepID=A0ACC3NHD4_9PEZI|nr:hypothetical protein LTR37_006179 [Vermiconidia calcicola]
METSGSSLYRTESGQDLQKRPTTSSSLNRVSTRIALEHAHTRADLEAAFSAASLAKEPSRPIVPERTRDGTILVDWYDTSDPANPQNWSQAKKAFASFLICLYTLAFYMGSAIYTPSAAVISEKFGVSQEVSALGLSLYVLAYGLGPLLFSPLSEIPSIGRNPPYIISFGIFVILSIPTALVNNVPGLMVLRFLQGFFGSPCLATGGASLQDMYSLIKLPYVLCLWALAATCGPALGPVISGFSVPAMNWHWSLWEILWLSAPIFLAMALFLPETSTPNILLRRAQRLRKLTGNNNLKAQSEIDQANMTPGDVAYEALVRPAQLIFMDPAIGFTAGYIALCYGIYYSFFEAFPLVYIGLYGFSVGEMGLTFLSITVGVILSIALYWTYIWKVVEPDIRANGLGAPEKRLIPALASSMLLPIGLFIFGWTGNGDIHWIVSVVGILIFTVGVFILMQCVFVYLPMVYPQYAASLFAGNDAARSFIAFAAVMFGHPMYIGMGIGAATSMLGGLTAACVGGIFVLYLYGAKLRARSRFSAK